MTLLWSGGDGPEDSWVVLSGAQLTGSPVVMRPLSNDGWRLIRDPRQGAEPESRSLNDGGGGGVCDGDSKTMVGGDVRMTSLTDGSMWTVDR
ncbi:hypothetical protein STEG23_024635 [Scotinomys teguina]